MLYSNTEYRKCCEIRVFGIVLKILKLHAYSPDAQSPGVMRLGFEADH
jgi:hypothetical protein